MKKTIVSTLAVLSLAQGAFASDMNTTVVPLGEAPVEIGIQNLFVPTKGYDDNDSVSLVMAIKLPNHCYRAGATKVEMVPGSNVLVVKQYMEKDLNKLCLNEAILPDFMKVSRPEMVVYSLGVLPTGHYEIQFTKPNRTLGSRTFEVEVAPTASTDSFKYASTNTVMVDEVVSASKSVGVTLSGILTSSCTSLNKDAIKVERVGDVFVVRPVLNVKPGMCLQYVTPFKKVISLGKVKRGRYAVHIRSMGGQAVNRIFEVR